ncbi:unnamed protein product, partial [Acidocella sp. C78]
VSTETSRSRSGARPKPPAEALKPSPLPPPVLPASIAPHEPVSTTDALDRSLHAAEARLTAGLAPAGIALAWRDWAVHLANQPTRRMDLARRAMEDWAAVWRVALGLEEAVTPPCDNDHRFDHPAGRTCRIGSTRNTFSESNAGGTMRRPASPGSMPPMSVSSIS